MNGFFSVDGPFARYGNLVADIVLLGLAWLFFSIPVFTIGASTSALYYVTTRRIANREGYIMRDFWTSFKTNFKKATLIWLLMLTIITILVINIANLEVMGNLSGLMLPFQVVFLIEAVIVLIYAFPLVARFDMKFLQVLKSALYMANRHLLTTAACLALAVLMFFIIYMYFIFFLVAMGVYGYLSSLLIMRVFKKYRPEMDSNTQADLRED